MPYLIVLEPGSNSWSAYAPDLPGVATAGKDEQITERLMCEALALHLYAMAEDNDAIPAQTSTPEDYLTGRPATSPAWSSPPRPPFAPARLGKDREG